MIIDILLPASLLKSTFLLDTLYFIFYKMNVQDLFKNKFEYLNRQDVLKDVQSFEHYRKD